MKLNSNFQRDVGVLEKKPSVGEGCIFSGITHYNLIHYNHIIQQLYFTMLSYIIINHLIIHDIMFKNRTPVFYQSIKTQGIPECF